MSSVVKCCADFIKKQSFGVFCGLNDCSKQETIPSLRSFTMTKKVLRLRDFLELSEKEQFDLLHTDGVHVGKRKLGKQTVILFQLNGFYVEVYYKQYRKLIDHISTSENTDILQPYLDQVHIRDLKNGKESDE